MTRISSRQVGARGGGVQHGRDRAAVGDVVGARITRVDVVPGRTPAGRARRAPPEHALLERLAGRSSPRRHEAAHRRARPGRHRARRARLAVCGRGRSSRPRRSLSAWWRPGPRHRRRPAPRRSCSAPARRRRSSSATSSRTSLGIAVERVAVAARGSGVTISSASPAGNGTPVSSAGSVSTALGALHPGHPGRQAVGCRRRRRAAGRSGGRPRTRRSRRRGTASRARCPMPPRQRPGAGGSERSS